MADPYYIRARRILNAGSASRTGRSPRRASLDEEDRVAVHPLFVVVEDFDRVAGLEDRREDVDAHGFGRGPGELGLLAFRAGAHAVGAEAAAVHEQQEGLDVSRKEDILLEGEEGLVDSARPGVPVLGLVHRFFEMEDGRRPVVPEEPLALLDGRGVGRAAGVLPVVGAAEAAFHPHPLGDDDLLRVDPAEVRVPVLPDQRFERLGVGHGILLRSISLAGSFDPSAIRQESSQPGPSGSVASHNIENGKNVNRPGIRPGIRYNGPVISVILARPENPENIGLAARAMKNTGFRDLRLTGLRRIRVKAFAAAVHAADILEGARLFPDLPSATADLQVVFAATARPRSNFPALALDEALDRIRSYPPSTRIGLLFGNERTGLTTEEMRSSSFRFSIPQAGRQPSYNLASAVLLTLFPLFASATTRSSATTESAALTTSSASTGLTGLSATSATTGSTRLPADSPLARAAQDAVIGRILDILEGRGFLHDTNRRHVTDVAFELFGRLAMTAKDRNLLLAIFHKGAGEGPPNPRKES
jgi:TrmH family RNA methyltransferase